MTAGPRPTHGHRGRYTSWTHRLSLPAPAIVVKTATRKPPAAPTPPKIIQPPAKGNG